MKIDEFQSELISFRDSQFCQRPSELGDLFLKVSFSSEQSATMTRLRYRLLNYDLSLACRLLHRCDCLQCRYSRRGRRF
jgi:hypothetical protein